jgi:DNA replication protein DnaC
MKSASDMIKAAVSGMEASVEETKKREVDKEYIQTATGKYRDKFIELGYDDSAGVMDTISMFCAYYRLNLAKRGLFFTGNVGTGKTFAMQLLARLFPRRIVMVTAQQIVDEHKRAGHQGDRIKNKYGRLKAEDYDENNIWDGYTYRFMDLVIDDVGTEHIRNDYGEVYELISHIIAIRDQQYRDTGAKTFITSNLRLEELAERYDDRTRSRIEGMCTVVAFRGEDRRKGEE